MRGCRGGNTINFEDILQGDDALKSVHVGPADHRKSVQMGYAHALERQSQRMIRVDVGKFLLGDKLFEQPRAAPSAAAFSRAPRLTIPATPISSLTGQV